MPAADDLNLSVGLSAVNDLRMVEADARYAGFVIQTIANLGFRFASPQALCCPHASHAVTLQPANQQLPLVNHLRRQTVVQIEEQLLVPQHFLSPG